MLEQHPRLCLSAQLEGLTVVPVSSDSRKTRDPTVVPVSSDSRKTRDPVILCIICRVFKDLKIFNQIHWPIIVTFEPLRFFQVQIDILLISNELYISI